MKQHHILFIEQFFFPEGWSGADIPRDIAHHLVKSCTSFVVLCGSKPYVTPTDLPRHGDPRTSGISLRRLFSLGVRSNWSIRLIDNFLFSFQVFFNLIFSRRFSLAITQTNPPLSVVAVALASLLRHKPYIIIAIDIYPDALFAGTSLKQNSLFTYLLRLIFDFAYSNATSIVSLGRSMSERLVHNGVLPERIVEIPNWATGNLSIRKGISNKLIKTWQLDHTFTVLYSGNLGLPHEIETAIYAIKLLSEDFPFIRLLCVASGSRIDNAKKLVLSLNLESNVIFKPLVASSELPDTMGIANIALVTLRPGFEGLVVPSKFAGFLARGLPVVYVGPPSDLSLIIDQSGVGSCFLNGESLQLSNYLRNIILNPSTLDNLSFHSKSYYDNYFSASSGLSKYHKLVSQILEY